MQKSDIHCSPNNRNELAEIGAEIIIHTFDRPTNKDSGEVLYGGTDKKRTNLNYPLNEKNPLKVDFVFSSMISNPSSMIF